MSEYIFWITDDGADWGRSTVDRHGRSRTNPPDDARVVTEPEYRNHLAEVRANRDNQIAKADAAWRSQALHPSLVVEPAESPEQRQVDIARAYLEQAARGLDDLADLVHDYVSGDRVKIDGKITTDADTFAEIEYELGVEPVPSTVTATAGLIVHSIRAALDQAHKSAVPSRRVDGELVRVGFPIPATIVPGGDGWPEFAIQHTARVTGADSLLSRIYGDVDPGDWKAHPMRRLRALVSVEPHQSIARVAAIAEVRGDGMTRVHGVAIGDDFTLPNRTDGTRHAVRFSLDSSGRESQIDRLRDLIARCEALADNDISFAMYSKAEELEELQLELDSWYPPFEIGVEVNSSVTVMAAGAKNSDIVTELGHMISFADAAITRYQAFVDSQTDG